MRARDGRARQAELSRSEQHHARLANLSGRFDPPCEGCACGFQRKGERFAWDARDERSQVERASVAQFLHGAHVAARNGQLLKVPEPNLAPSTDIQIVPAYSVLWVAIRRIGGGNLGPRLVRHLRPRCATTPKQELQSPARDADGKHDAADKQGGSGGGLHRPVYRAAPPGSVASGVPTSHVNARTNWARYLLGLSGPYDFFDPRSKVKSCDLWRAVRSVEKITRKRGVV